ncbi:MAG: hypothetical protein WC749_13400 [Dehalococcoidia bacterium]
MQYKRLLMVEQFFRAAKSMLHTRPLFYQWDATIKGHVFCSFLALVLLDELKRRLRKRGWELGTGIERHPAGPSVFGGSRGSAWNTDLPSADTRAGCRRKGASGCRSGHPCVSTTHGLMTNSVLGQQ